MEERFFEEHADDPRSPVLPQAEHVLRQGAVGISCCDATFDTACSCVVAVAVGQDSVVMGLVLGTFKKLVLYVDSLIIRGIVIMGVALKAGYSMGRPRVLLVVGWDNPLSQRAEPGLDKTRSKV